MKYKYHCLISLILFFNIQTLTAQSWVQVSNTLYGLNTGNMFGKSVSLNSDGTIIAASSDAGVIVHKLVNNNWVQQGNIIEECGFIIKLSKDGTALIIGCSGAHDSLGHWYGSVQVYKWNGNDWVKKGNKLYGSHHAGFFGHSVGINHDGSTIVVYSRYELNRVRAYQWNESLSVWEQKGNTISLGLNGSSVTEGSIDFSSDGTTIIIGNPYINNGKVGVFIWNGSDWIQKGQIIDGSTNEKLGTNVNINSNGNVILIGSPLIDNNGNTGELKIYEWNGEYWNQKGQTFNGAKFASSIDDSGNVFAYWSYNYDNPYISDLKIFSWNINQWSQKGTNIEGGLGETLGVNFMSLSSDGNTVSIGFPHDFYFNDGIQTGRVKIYYFNDLNLGPDRAICENDSVLLDPGKWYSTYLWSTMDTTQGIYAKEEGYYHVMTTDESGFVDYDTLYLTVYQKPELDLGPDIAGCSGNSVILNSGYSGENLWNTGSVSESLTVENTGTYSVVITDIHLCENRDSVNVIFHPLPDVNLGADTTISLNQTLVLSVDSIPDYDYLWHNGSTNSFIIINKNSITNYSLEAWVEVTSNFECKNNDTLIITLDTNYVYSDSVEIKVGPIPTSKIVNINSNYVITNINCYDIDGRYLFSKQPNSKTDNISVEALSRGTYILRITTINGIRKTFRILKL